MLLKKEPKMKKLITLTLIPIAVKANKSIGAIVVSINKINKGKNNIKNIVPPLKKDFISSLRIFTII